LQTIVGETVNFDFPLVQVDADKYSLELFHGPTLAFKDVGARFMSRCLGYFNRNSNRHTTVLVATSGDTGGAVANGFLGVEGVEVVILYPSGKVSHVQEQQLTTCGQNITALEVAGTFDDCQRMVKAAFADKALAARRRLTSANSINVARWLPQQLYYWLAWQQWPAESLPYISVPSGNFGNLCAGMLAQATGLPVHKFIAACNANDVVPAFLQTGRYAPKAAQATLSNAMDVGDPSNWVRIMELFGQQTPTLKEKLVATSISDATTEATILDVWNTYGYMLDPHGAVGYAALQEMMPKGSKGIVLETAHPVKFAPALEPILNQEVPIPTSLAPLLAKKKQAVQMAASSEALRDFLLS
jgi:threonine synthase